jgi:aspartate kinase
MDEVTPTGRTGRCQDDDVPVAQAVSVLKFGGTSVAAADGLRRLVEIVGRAAGVHRPVVVASALGGVTDTLVAALNALEAGPSAGFGRDAFLDGLRHRHERLAGEVLGPRARATYAAVLEAHLAELQATLSRIEGTGVTPPLRDAVLASGERMAVPLVAQVLEEAGFQSVPVDARALVRTDATHGEAVVDLPVTFRQMRAWHQVVAPAVIPVVTGFIGSTAAGDTTTLGRGGSDYSAALLASALRAAVLERWTDVDGIYTDDPRKNKDAQRLACIVLEEAWAWNHAGRLGMHRKALDPLVSAGIPVHVRSTLAPDLPGTFIFPAQRARIATATG